MNIPAKEWNAEKGKMEDTSLPHWQEYYRKLKEFRERMEAKKPKPYDYGDDDFYRIRLGEWEMACFCDAPNKPGYLIANND